MAYTSAKYPWIIAAHRYQNLQDSAQFHHEYDMISVDFPNAAPGHYMVHWAWAGDVAHPEAGFVFHSHDTCSRPLKALDCRGK